MKKFLLFAVFAILSACSGDDVLNMHKEVMEVHDEVMPRMAEIAELRAELENKLNQPDSFVRLNRIEFEGALKELSDAKQGMVTWMQNYEKPDAEMAKESALAYLSEQKDAIEVVKQDMESSISLAKTILQ